jgi:hypothetical protein
MIACKSFGGILIFRENSNQFKLPYGEAFCTGLSLQTLILKNTKKNYLELTLRCLVMLKKILFIHFIAKYTLLQRIIPTKVLTAES